jgi:hypothetical protein
MALLQITSALGDSPTRSIPLVVDVEADQTPFTPTVNWVLLLTAKALLTDPDGAAKFQLKTGLGITHNGSSAVCALAPTATLGTAPANLYFDIRATHQITGETHLVARGRWNLTRPATRLAIPSMPIYTTTPGTGPDLSAMTGLGAGIKTAISKDVETVGSVQIYGSPMAPVSITLPDLTGTVPDLNALGVSGGRLILGDGNTENGVVVGGGWRISGMSQISLAGQPQSGAFTKVFSIPLTAAQMAQGQGYIIQGSVTVAGTGQFFDYTNLRMGWSFLAGSTAMPPIIPSGGTVNNLWRARNVPPPVNFNPGSAAGRLQKTRFDVNSAMVWLGSSTQAIIGSNPSYGVGVASYMIGDDYPMITYGEGGGTTMGTVDSLSPIPSALIGVANELCWMFGLESAGVGNYGSTARVSFSWDLEVIPLL